MRQWSKSRPLRPESFVKDKILNSAYTGYIDIEARHIFFYFFESRSNPATDDVIFWTNGGISMALIWLVSCLNVWNYKDLVARRLLGYLWSLVRFDSCCSVYWGWDKQTSLKVHAELRELIAPYFILNHGTQTRTSSSSTSQSVSDFHMLITENLWWAPCLIIPMFSSNAYIIADES